MKRIATVLSAIVLLTGCAHNTDEQRDVQLLAEVVNYPIVEYTVIPKEREKVPFVWNSVYYESEFDTTDEVVESEVVESNETLELPENKEPMEDLTGWVSLGTYTLTAYCPCANCCGKSDGITATGTVATAGHTIAVDPNVIPYGSQIKINGVVYVAEDCGGAIKDNKIDIFFDSHDEALQFGRRSAEVFIWRGV